jgi:2-haloacid dehalogenase
MGGNGLAAASVLTFDCYGTLIDWEQGILDALRSVMGEAVDGQADRLLEEYADHEAAAEAGPWQPYRQILGNSLAAVCSQNDFEPAPNQLSPLGGSVADWPAFPDSAAALARLRTRFDLGVITNCDDDLFALTNERLGKPFRWIVTAEQVKSYKPSRRNFEAAFERIARPRTAIVHVAQSLYHDHVPAKELGLTTVWINRRVGRQGAGATPAASATPDFTFPDMASFAAWAVT